MDLDPATAEQFLTYMLKPWQDALGNPAGAQEAVLHRLLQEYARTDYGKAHGAGNIDTLQDYRRSFPVATYDDLQTAHRQVISRRDTATALGGAGRVGHHARHNARRIEIHPHDPYRPADESQRRPRHDELRAQHAPF